MSLEPIYSQNDRIEDLLAERDALRAELNSQIQQVNYRDLAFAALQQRVEELESAQLPAVPCVYSAKGLPYSAADVESLDTQVDDLHSQLTASRAEAAQALEALKDIKQRATEMGGRATAYLAEHYLATLDSSTALSWLQSNYIPRAEVEAMQREWQPIGTAPKGGPILIGWFDLPGQRMQVVGWWNVVKNKWSNLYVSYVQPPTHWMSLPSPPASKEKE